MNKAKITRSGQNCINSQEFQNGPNDPKLNMAPSDQKFKKAEISQMP